MLSYVDEFAPIADYDATFMLHALVLLNINVYVDEFAPIAQ